MVTYSSNDLVNRLVARLERDPRVNLHNSPVTVCIEQDQVILEGQVDNIAEKRAAIDTVTRALLPLGRLPIIDRLHVKPTRHRENMDMLQSVMATLSNESVFNDYSLLSKVPDHIKLYRDKGAGSRLIIVSANNGCITLAGQVESRSHQRLAEVLMWWTDGCEFVDNHLQIVPPGLDNDNEISDAIRCVLEKDPLVHASQLQVGTAGGVVYLNGCLASEAEKKLAIRDAWYVPGVADVVDRIQARG